MERGGGLVMIGTMDIDIDIDIDAGVPCWWCADIITGSAQVTSPHPPLALVGGGRNCVMRHGPTTVLATQPSPAQPSPAQHREVIHAEALVLTHFYLVSCGGLPPWRTRKDLGDMFMLNFMPIKVRYLDPSRLIKRNKALYNLYTMVLWMWIL